MWLDIFTALLILMLLIVAPVASLWTLVKSKHPFLKLVSKGFLILYGIAVTVFVVMYLAMNGSIIAGFIVAAFIGFCYFYLLPITVLRDIIHRR